MTREEARKAAEVMLAYANGEEVEVMGFGGQYKTVEKPSFDWEKIKYRVKPKPTYRPFKDKEECWNEMLKHEPFGWVKNIPNAGGFCSSITDIRCDGVCDFIRLREDWYRPDSVFVYYTFFDGTPFGIKEG